MLCLNLNEIKHHLFPSCTLLSPTTFIQNTNPFLVGKHWGVWANSVPWTTRAHKPGPQMKHFAQREKSCPETSSGEILNLGRTLPSAPETAEWLLSYQWSVLRITGGFPHLRRSQIHSGLNALTAYWKPTDGWCSVLRINYVIFKISKRHIFSSNKEQILTKLWTVGSGNPLAAHLFDSGEIPHEDERLVGRQDQLSSQEVKIKYRW